MVYLLSTAYGRNTQSILDTTRQTILVCLMVSLKRSDIALSWSVRGELGLQFCLRRAIMSLKAGDTLIINTFFQRLLSPTACPQTDFAALIMAMFGHVFTSFRYLP